MAVSTEDIARATGLHRTTVSRALRNHPRISQKTIDRVQAAARKLGYRTNPFVSEMMAQRAARQVTSFAGRLALLTPFVKIDHQHVHYSFRGYLRGIRDRMEERCFEHDVFPLTLPAHTPRRLSRILQARGLSGVCIAPMPRALSRLPLEWGQFAASAVGFSLLKPVLHRAAPHQYHNTWLLLRKLSKLGYRRIGLCVSSQVSRRADENWLAAFLAFQYLHPQHELKILRSPAMDRDLHRWLRHERPEVLVSDSSSLLDYLERDGWRVPEDIAYASLNWNPEMREHAGVDTHFEQVGASAVDLLIAQLQRNERGLPKHPRTMLIEGTWVPGPTAPGR